MQYRAFGHIILILVFAGLLTACPSADSSYANRQANSVHWQHIARSKTVWHAMSKHYELRYNPKERTVRHEIRWFLDRPHYVKQLTKNAGPYIYYVYQQTRLRDMPAEIALIPMIENNYSPFGYSRTGAVGLWQMMPGTASGYGLTINWWYDGRRSVTDSTKAALEYLQYLHDYFGNWLLAIAAYDSGPGTVQNAVEYNKRHGRPTDYWDLPLPYETKMYVPKLLALAAVIKDSVHYGIQLTPVPDKPFFTPVDMHKQISLGEVAKLSDTNIHEILALNPGFRRWATTPNTDYTLLLPVGTKRLFLDNLKQSKATQVTWLHHKTQPGDSLSSLAHKYQTDVSVLKRVNHLHNNMIRVGQDLLIPLAYRGKTLEPLLRQRSRIAEDYVPGPQRAVYSVKSHDSLWTIAARYGVKPRQIRFWNDLAYHTILKVGEKLTIWEPRHHHHRDYRYHVRNGDSLDRIARRFDVTVYALKVANDLKSNMIHVGQKLRIPPRSLAHGHYHARLKNQMVVHTVRAGESLDVIARYYRVSVKNLIRWNHLKHQKYLRVGQHLKIYIHR